MQNDLLWMVGVGILSREEESNTYGVALTFRTSSINMPLATAKAVAEAMLRVIEHLEENT